MPSARCKSCGTREQHTTRDDPNQATSLGHSLRPAPGTDEHKLVVVVADVVLGLLDVRLSAELLTAEVAPGTAMLLRHILVVIGWRGWRRRTVLGATLHTSILSAELVISPTGAGWLCKRRHAITERRLAITARR